MFYTAICDDEALFREKAKTMLGNVLDEKGRMQRLSRM